MHMSLVRRNLLRGAFMGALLLSAPGAVAQQTQLPDDPRQLNMLLFDATERGVAGEVAAILEKGGSVEARNRFGSTALVIAAGGGHLDVVKMLVAADSDIDYANVAGSTALLRATMEGHAKTAKYLIGLGAKVGQVNRKGLSPIAGAAFNGDDEIVELLLARKADPDIRDNTGKAPILYAAAKGFVDIVEMLLDQGVDVNALYGNDLTLLMWAAGYANDVPAPDGVDTVMAVLERGAALDPRDDRGRTALMTAAAMGHVEVVQALLSAGARTDIKDKKGMTATDLATSESQAEVAALLNSKR
jgi:ankyrin repeat protein